MAFIRNLTVGKVLLVTTLAGFWSARSLEFYQQDIVQGLLWVRILPDMIFIVLGVVPLLLGLWQAVRNERPATPIEEPVREEVRHIAPPLVGGKPSMR